MAVKKILIVDDSPTDRQFFMETLSKQGYQVVTAENGDEAITKSKSERPDLILMDVVMPGTNGFQATRAITRDEATKHIPVIVVTSKNQETDRCQGVAREGRGDQIGPRTWQNRSACVSFSKDSPRDCGKLRPKPSPPRGWEC